ncbi:MAG: hypothetical protein P8N02_00570 [Actinomycetota bacterium]|nr:hypothetical protein [Actinomycetota bacterium]
MSNNTQFASLRRQNVGVVAIRLLQASAILALSNDFAIPEERPGLASPSRHAG